MKASNKIIIVLAIIGGLAFGIVNFVIIPNINEKNDRYTIEQQDPITHDIDNVIKYKSKYMGDFSNIANLFYNLPLSNKDKTFELFPNDYELKINYNEKVEDNDKNSINQALIYNSIVAFSLIDNLQSIRYKFNDLKYKILRSNINKLYGEDLSSLLEKNEWKIKVQDNIKSDDNVSNIIKEVMEIS